MAEPDSNRVNPVIVQTYAKPPKEYKFGSDFRTYIARFELYCQLNNIPDANRAPLLFTLLDTQAFNIARNLQIRNMNDYRQVTAKLIEKFEPIRAQPPAGELE